MVGTRHLEKEARGDTFVGIERLLQPQPGDRGDERRSRRLDRDPLDAAPGDVPLPPEDLSQALGCERIEGEGVTHDRNVFASRIAPIEDEDIIHVDHRCSTAIGRYFRW